MAFYGMMDSGPSPIDQYIGRYQQNQESRKQQERALAQNQSQFDATHALNVKSTDASVGRDTALRDKASSEQKLQEAAALVQQRMPVWDKYRKEGRTDLLQADVQDFVAANPTAGYVLGKWVNIVETDGDRASQNSFKYAADITGKVANGSQDLQGRNLATKFATGEQLNAAVTPDAAARQLSDPAFQKGEHADSIRVDAGLRTSANQSSVNQTQITTQAMSEAGTTARNNADNATTLQVAGMRGAAASDPATIDGYANAVVTGQMNISSVPKENGVRSAVMKKVAGTGDMMVPNNVRVQMQALNAGYAALDAVDGAVQKFESATDMVQKAKAAKELKDQTAAFTRTVGRALGERGVFTDQDKADFQKLISPGVIVSIVDPNWARTYLGNARTIMDNIQERNMSYFKKIPSTAVPGGGGGGGGKGGVIRFDKNGNEIQ